MFDESEVSESLSLSTSPGFAVAASVESWLPEISWNFPGAMSYAM